MTKYSAFTFRDNRCEFFLLQLDIYYYTGFSNSANFWAKK